MFVLRTYLTGEVKRQSALQHLTPLPPLPPLPLTPTLPLFFFPPYPPQVLTGANLTGRFLDLPLSVKEVDAYTGRGHGATRLAQPSRAAIISPAAAWPPYAIRNYPIQTHNKVCNTAGAQAFTLRNVAPGFQLMPAYVQSRSLHATGFCFTLMSCQPGAPSDCRDRMKEHSIC